MPLPVELGPDAGKGKVHVTQIKQAAMLVPERPSGQRPDRTVIRTVGWDGTRVVLQFQYQSRGDGGEVIYVERARFATGRGKR